MAFETGSLVQTRNRDTGDLIKYWALGGFVAGIVFAMFEMVMAAVLNGASAFWNPLRMIGATVGGIYSPA